MKKIILLILLAAIFNSCERIALEPEGKIISLVDLREAKVPITVIDDSVKQATVISLYPEAFVYNWHYGLYGSGLVKTRLLFAELTSEMQIIVIGQYDLDYTDLIILRYYHQVASYKLNVVTIRYLKLLTDNQSLLIRYNNTWTRTGPLPDEEKTFILP